MSATSLLTRVTDFVDLFIPDNIAVDHERRKQARLFLYSHVFGPFIGNSVPLALYLLDPAAGLPVGVLFLSITGFWIFPFLLRKYGSYNLLAILSVQNLIFCILWSCYYYGGVTSPTLPWVLTIPLLAFFYVGPSPSLRTFVLSQFAVSLGVFFYLYQTHGHVPIAMSLNEQQGLGLISTSAASLYVAMMALFYASALASQVEIEAEVKEHLITAAQLRLATAEATRAGAAKSDFLAKMSHELRTPLNAVIGYSEMLLEDAANDHDAGATDDLRKINSAGHHLLKLVNEILDLSKIDAGKMEVYNEIADCGQVLKRIVDVYAAQDDSRGNKVSIVGWETIGKVYTDFGKLHQIIGELVDNAMRHTSGGEVAVSVERVRGVASDEIAIGVRDTGEGIAADRIPALFEQFNVADDESASKYGRTGLGLALCSRLCGLLNGSIAVETKLGGGSTFTVRLPAKAHDGINDEDVAAALSEAEAHGRQLRQLSERNSEIPLGLVANG